MGSDALFCLLQALAMNRITIWPGCTTLGLYWKYSTSCHRNTCTSLFTSALFTIARKWTIQRGPLTHECVVKYGTHTQWNCVWVYMFISIHARGSQISTLSVFLDFSSAYLLRHGFPLNPMFTYWPECLASKLQRSPMSLHLALGSQMYTIMPGFFFFFNMGAGDLNSGCHTCVVGTLPTESIP